MTELTSEDKVHYLHEQLSQCLMKRYRNEVDERRLKATIDSLASASKLPQVQRAIDDYQNKISEYRDDTTTINIYIEVIEEMLDELSPTHAV